MARLGDKRNVCRMVLIVKGRSALEDVGSIILKWISKIMDGRLWSGIIQAYVKGKCAVLNTAVYACVRDISWSAEDTVSFREDFVPYSWFCDQFPALRSRSFLPHFLLLRETVLVMSMESCLFLVPACGPTPR